MKHESCNRHTLTGEVLHDPKYIPGSPSRLRLTVVTPDEREVAGKVILSTPYHDVVLHGNLAETFKEQVFKGDWVHLEGPSRSRDKRTEVHAYKFHVIAEEENNGD